MKKNMNNLKEEYVYKDCKIRMSKNAMSDLLYAIIMTHSEISCTYGIGIYDYSRSQNSYNVWVLAKLPNTKVKLKNKS